MGLIWLLLFRLLPDICLLEIVREVDAGVEGWCGGAGGGQAVPHVAAGPLPVRHQASPERRWYFDT